MEILKDVRTKEHFLGLVEKLEAGLFGSKLLRQQGWVVDQRRKRSPRFKYIGGVTYKRRRWRNELTGEKRFLVDELLGLEYRVRVHKWVKDEIRELLRDEQSPKQIIYIIERYLKVRIGKTLISKLFNQDNKDSCPYKSKEKEPVDPERNWIYLQLDEGELGFRGEKREIKGHYGRVCSIYTNLVTIREQRRFDILDALNIKKPTRARNKRLGTRFFVEIYMRGEKVNNREYVERLLRFIWDNYEINKDTIIYGACDGDPKLQKIIKMLPNSKLAACRWHYLRSDNRNKYYESNKEGLDIYEDMVHGPRLYGSSAESDIFNVLKKKLGCGNKIYSPTSFSNLLRWQGACIGQH